VRRSGLKRKEIEPGDDDDKHIELVGIREKAYNVMNAIQE
jgi:hypothetical protein